MKKLIALSAALLCALALSPSLNAQTGPTIIDGYNDLRGVQQVGTLGPDLFGEQVNFADGAAAFYITDVSVRTNSGLPMSVGRKLVINARQIDVRQSELGGGTDDPGKDVFGQYWELDVPYMRGRFDQRTGWVSELGGNRRCSVLGNPAMPPTVYGVGPFGATPYEAFDYWDGNSINIPGHGEETLHSLATSRVRPSDGLTYYGVTKSEWRVACTSSIQNGPGEGYLVVLPDGTRYTFDWMVSRYTSSIVGTTCYDDSDGHACSQGVSVPRYEVYLYATRVEDRFGNWVAYNYDPTTPHRLLSVTSNEGTAITLSYDPEGKIKSVTTTGGRTWAYIYSGAPSLTKTLTDVVQPDSSRWSYQYDGLGIVTYSDSTRLWSSCALNVGSMASSSSPGPGETASVTITHPSGAMGTFRFRRLIHGTNRTPGYCYIDPIGYQGESVLRLDGVPMAYQVASLYAKSITGPGLPSQNWSYFYTPTWSWRSDCPQGVSCASTSQTKVTGPDSMVTTYIVGNDYAANAGQVLEVRTEEAGVIVQRITNTYVASAEGQSFPDEVGHNLNGRNNPFATKFRPLRKREIAQNGATFTWEVDGSGSTYGFDAFARPLSVTKSSSLGYSRTEATAYHDDLTLWVLGQVKSVTCTAPAACKPSWAPNGIVVSQTDYGWKALPWKTYAFGKLQQTFSYNTADGTLKTVTDGRGNVTTLSNWKRGIPQSIKYPPTPEAPTGATESAVVNDDGTIASVTDENGYVTSYGYDAMGRLNRITYPTGDTTAWNVTTLTFAPVATAEYGIPVGHWKQTISTGYGRQVTYFDALWRPLVEESYDATNQSGTRSVTVKRYDTGGRLAFQSYPLRSLTDYNAATLQGIRTTYDALDRITRVEQNSELGVLVTSTSYRDGFKTEVTNPRNYVTTINYQAYDQPTTDWPVAIAHPEGAYTDIVRDVFGKPTSLKRRNSSSSVALTRSYVYDTNQQLCKTIEPETGSTVYSYDAAGNLAWSAAGLALPSTTNCDTGHTSVAARKVPRDYDARNRITTLLFPDMRGDTSYTYTPDGLLETITAENGSNTVTTTYSYNKRRLLTGERMQWGLIDWTLGYAYNANGHLSSHTYPSGLNVAYAPNALGQPTKAGTYATGVSYHPNGAMAQFTYGNGIVHTLDQNERGLPELSRDAYGATAVLDDGYVYDRNGNVDLISDGLSGNRGDRDMTYDGLDRLIKTTTSPMFGTATYTYDVLDNLTRATLTDGSAARDQYYCYDTGTNPTWRLTAIKSGNCSGPTVTPLTYDVQGNLSSKGGGTYDFDYGNRLRSATVGGSTSSYVYDGNGRRVRDLIGGSKYSLYSQAGQLMYTSDSRQEIRSDYIYLNGSLVARRANPYNLGVPTLDVPAGTNGTGSYTVSWSALTQATRYELQEQVNGGAWSRIYNSAGTSTTRSGRSNGTYGYRARGCINSVCGSWSPVATVAVTLKPTTAPTVTVPGTNSTGGYTVSWTSVLEATTYRVEESVNGGTWTEIDNTIETSLALTRQVSATYRYRARGCNAGGCGPYSGTPAVVVDLVPTLSGPGFSASGTFTLTWSGVAGATGYELQRSIDGGAWSAVYSGTASSFNAPSSPDGMHAHRVRRCNGSACSSWSAVLYTAINVPPGGAPVLSPAGTTTISSGPYKYVVSWPAVPGATRYVLDRRKDGGTWTSYDLSGSQLSLYVSPAFNGTYDYRVMACNDAGCTAYSAITTIVVSGSYPPPVAVPNPVHREPNTTGSYTVSWDPVQDATSYRLEESFNSSDWVQIYVGTATSYAVSGRAAGIYSYQVTPCYPEGCGLPIKLFTIEVVYTPTGAPTLTVPATNSSGGYTVSWTTVSTATSYRLEESINGGAWAEIQNASATSMALSGKASGTYSYRARGCNAAGCGPYSNTPSVVVTRPPASAPVVTAPSTNDTGSYTVSWTGVATATRYELQEQVNGGTWTEIHDASTTSKAVSGKGNGSYGYRARACNAGGCGPFSSVMTTTVTRPPASAPTVTAPATNYTGSYTVSWTGVATATRYELQEQVNGGTWAEIHDASTTSKAVSGKGNGSYGYRARACNAGGCGAFSVVKTTAVTLKPASAPAVTAPAINYTGSYSVSWTTVSTATSYRLEEQVNGGTWTQIQDAAGTSRAISGKGNGTYGYRARACNVAGCGSYSAVKTTQVTRPPSSAPTLTGPYSSPGDYVVSWTSVATATSYQLEKQRNGGTWNLIQDSASTSKMITPNLSGDYGHRVRACNAGGCGPYSAVVTVSVELGGGGGGCPTCQPDAVEPQPEVAVQTNEGGEL